MITLVIKKEDLILFVRNIKNEIFIDSSPTALGDYINIVFYLQKFNNNINEINLTLDQVKIIINRLSNMEELRKCFISLEYSYSIKHNYTIKYNRIDKCWNLNQNNI